MIHKNSYKYNRSWNRYKIKTIEQDGVTCVSVVGSGLTYRDSWFNNEPEGSISKEYKNKVYPRGRILKKLGLWEEIQRGQNLKQVKKSK